MFCVRVGCFCFFAVLFSLICFNDFSGCSWVFLGFLWMFLGILRVSWDFVYFLEFSRVSWRFLGTL